MHSKKLWDPKSTSIAATLNLAVIFEQLLIAGGIQNLPSLAKPDHPQYERSVAKRKAHEKMSKQTFALLQQFPAFFYTGADKGTHHLILKGSSRNGGRL